MSVRTRIIAAVVLLAIVVVAVRQLTARKPSPLEGINV